MQGSRVAQQALNLNLTLVEKLGEPLREGTHGGVPCALTTAFTCRAGCKERDVSKNRNAGPVKCNALFALHALSGTAHRQVQSNGLRTDGTSASFRKLVIKFLFDGCPDCA